MGLEPKEIAITMLIVSIMFHYYSYSFTITAIDYQDYDLTIDLVDMYVTGIMIGEHDEHNISYNPLLLADDWTEFNIENSTIRLQWRDWLIADDSIRAQIQAQFFGFPMWVDFDWDVPGQDFIYNETIIDLYGNEAENMTIIRALTGYALFITDPLRQGNITRAVQVDGNLTLTLGQNVAWSEAPSVTSFISWYFGLVTGTESFGLPDNFSIVVRIISLLGMFAGVFLLSELRRIVI